MVDETPRAGEAPDAAVLRLAIAKARAVAQAPPPQRQRYDAILGADTIVAVDGAMLGKPADREHAAAMLRQLSGREHLVHTGLALVSGARCITRFGCSRVCLAPLDDALIARYLACGEADDKAGAYAIQGRGAALVASIEGSYSNIVGLPLCELVSALHELGLRWP